MRRSWLRTVVFPSAGDELRVKPGGIVIALVGVALTRSLLAAAVYGSGDPPALVGATVSLLPAARERLSRLLAPVGGRPSAGSQSGQPTGVDTSPTDSTRQTTRQSVCTTGEAGSPPTTAGSRSTRPPGV